MDDTALQKGNHARHRAETVKGTKEEHHE